MHPDVSARHVILTFLHLFSPFCLPVSSERPVDGGSPHTRSGGFIFFSWKGDIPLIYTTPWLLIKSRIRTWWNIIMSSSSIKQTVTSDVEMEMEGTDGCQPQEGSLTSNLPSPFPS